MAKEWLKALSYIPKVLGFGKKKVESTYTGFKILRDLGIPVKIEDFNSIYFLSLSSFETEFVKHTLLVDLFKESSTREAFKDDFYKGTDFRFLETLEANLHVKERYADIVDAGIDLRKEADHFISIFRKKLNESRSPKEKEESEAVSRIESKLDDLIISSKLVPNSSIDLSEYITGIAELREENKHEAVLHALEKFKTKKWETLTPELKYKLILNFAVTNFELGEKKEGAKFFLQLLDFQIKFEETFGYVALGFALLDDKGNAIEYANKAIALNKNNENAYLALLFAKESELTLDEIDTIIPKEIQIIPSIAINIGTFKEDKGDLEGALKIFENLEKEYKENDFFKIDILVQLANNRIRSLKQTDDYIFNQLKEADIEKLNYAIGKLTEAWEYLKGTDLMTSRWYVLANRGVAYKILGNKEKAEKDFRETLEIKKSYFVYRNLLQTLATDAKKLDEIFKEIESVELTSSERQELLLFRSEHEHSKGNGAAFVEPIVKELANVAEESLQRQYYGLITDIYLSEGDIDSAEKYAVEFSEKQPNDPAAYLLLGSVQFAKENNAGVLEYLTKAKGNIKDSTPVSVSLNIAEIFFKLGEFKEAASVLERVYDKDVLSPITQKLILSYFNATNYKSAFDIASTLLQKYPSDPFLIDVLSAISEASGHYDDAIKRLEEYLVTHPADEFMLLKLSMNYYKKSDYKKAVEKLDEIKILDNLSLRHQFLVADAYIKNKEFKKGLEIAYQIRLKNYNDYRTHNLYIQIQTQIRDLKSEDHFPSVIGEDCYVVLQDDRGKQREFVLVQSAEHEKEVSINEKLGQELLGKEINDTVSLGGSKYTIKTISLKYTYAFHDSLDQIKLRFDDQSSVRVMNFSEQGTVEEQLKEVFQAVDARVKLGKEVENLTRIGVTTIGVNSNLLGISPIEYWKSLVCTPDIGIVSVWGNDEIVHAHTQLQAGKDIILDITALLTLFYTDSFNQLSLISNKKYVSKSTVDLVREEIAELESGIDSSHLILNKVGDRYVRHEVTVEEKKAQLDKLKTFLELISNNLLEVDPPIADNYQEKQERDKLLGISFNETESIAKENDLLILSDDCRFRQICYNDSRIRGLSSIAFTGYLHTKKLIETQELEAGIIKRIKLNYRFIPVSPKVLMDLYKDSKYSVSYPFICACDVICPEYMDDIQACKLIVLFLYELYINSLDTNNRAFVVQYVLKKLFENRNASRIKRILVPFMDFKFRLLHTQKEEVYKFLEAL